VPRYTFQTNFTSGELAPSLDARLDVQRYHDGAELLWNMMVKPTGGTTRRPGTYFIHEVRDSTQRTYLVPFIFNQQQAYVLEMSPGHLRIYKDRALLLNEADVPIDITTPYTAGELPELRWAQSGDVLYFAHSNHPVHKLLRIEFLVWELRQVNFYPPPSIEAQLKLAATLTPGAGATVADTENVTFTASASVFLAGDKNKFINSGAGRAIISAVTSGTVVTAHIIDGYSSLGTIASGEWYIFGSPASDITPSAINPVRSRITVTASLASFRSTDVHSYLRFNNGLVRIATVTSSTSVQGDIITEPTSTSAALAGAWTLEAPSWSAERGYPGVVHFFESRLMAAASLAEPLTFWGSVTGDFENFALGPNDDDAVDYALAVGDFDRIRSLIGLRVLLMTTPGGEFQAHGGGDTPLTPTSIKVVQETVIGSDANVAPVTIGKASIFVQRGKQRLFEQSYDFATDAIVAIDLTAVAEHLFLHGRGVVGLVRQTVPLPYLYAVRGDGMMASCMYNRPEKVVAWTRWITGPQQDLSDGQYESACVIPNGCGTGDELWVVVQRLMADGSTRRYVEVFDGALNTDCALTADDIALNGMTGLEHLEDQEVDVVIDGNVFYVLRVADGQVELPDGVFTNHMEVGLRYRSIVRTLDPETPDEQGSAAARPGRMDKIIVRFLCTGPGCHVGSELNDTMEPYFPTEGLRHEDYWRTHLGWHRSQRVVVQQDSPFTMTVLAIEREIVIGEGEPTPP
jgi:hypothetical protein